MRQCILLMIGLALGAAPARAEGVWLWDEAAGAFVEVGPSLQLLPPVILPEAPVFPLPSRRGPGSFAPLAPHILAHLEAEAARHGLEPRLVHALVTAESSGGASKVSPKGALGLMQIMPATFAEWGAGDPFDPKASISAGAAYLRHLLETHEGRLELALAAYNAGPARVARYGGVPPFPETRRFVRRVLELLGEAPPSAPLDQTSAPVAQNPRNVFPET